MKRAILTSGLFLVMIALTSFTSPIKSGSPSQGDIKSGSPSQGDIKSGSPSQGDIKSGSPSQGDIKSGSPSQGDIVNPFNLGTSSQGE